MRRETAHHDGPEDIDHRLPGPGKEMTEISRRSQNEMSAVAARLGTRAYLRTNNDSPPNPDESPSSTGRLTVQIPGRHREQRVSACLDSGACHILIHMDLIGRFRVQVGNFTAVGSLRQQKRGSPLQVNTACTYV